MQPRAEAQARADEQVKVRKPVGILATERNFPRGSKGRDALRALAFCGGSFQA